MTQEDRTAYELVVEGNRMSAEVETMAYAKEGGVPWHGQGVEVKGATTSAIMIKKAQLDWTVSLVPTFARIDGNLVELPEQAIKRDSDGTIYGLVRDYTPVQNQDAFDLVDELVADGKLQFETAGALFEGRKVFMLARVPKEITIGSGKTEDRMIPYLYLYTGHDGNTALSIIPTTVRVVCSNTHNMAIRQQINGIQNKRLIFRMEHRGNMEGRIAKARQDLELATVEFGVFEKMATLLDEHDFPPQRVQKLLNTLFAPPAKDAKPWVVTKYDSLIGQIQANIAEERPTAWGVLNAITGYFEHQYEIPGAKADKLRPDRQMEYRMEGNGAKIKERVTDTVVTMAGIFDQLTAERDRLMVKVQRD